MSLLALLVRALPFLRHWVECPPHWGHDWTYSGFYRRRCEQCGRWQRYGVGRGGIDWDWE